MQFTLKAPCGNCPFRNDRPDNKGWLGKERAEEINETLNDFTFTCHKTIDKQEQFCAGALIMLKKENRLESNRCIRFAEYVKWFDRDKLNMDSPVVNNSEEFINNHTHI